ncbi:MAG: agmatinase [Alphaproteobacteria bacterium]|nr:agmatinase [Alphaproteobacteria bacterium]
MEPLTQRPRGNAPTFMGFDYCPDVTDFDGHVAILGLPFSDPYTIEEVTNDQTNAPTAVRTASHRLSIGLDHYDFDLGGPVLDNRPIRVLDCGDVLADARDLTLHYKRAEKAARILFEKGALVLSIGGDHGVPVPIFRALDVYQNVTMVHVDAHLDWRDDVNGVKEGYSNPLRRAAEMPHIGAMIQIGLRAQGSARQGEVDDARAYGSRLINSYEVLEHGMAPVLDQIPDGGTYYLTVDADGLDPTEMPAVAAPAPGGLLYHHVRTLIHGLARKGRLVGLDVVEITPMRDVNEISCITAGRIFLNAIGAAVRADYWNV